jgi:Transmembrane exosortase (Exosortase_EpsH)
MNVVRITLTVFLFRLASAEVAKVVFHDVAGWVMMPLALIVLLLELRFLSRLYLPVAQTGPVRVALTAGPAVAARPTPPVRTVPELAVRPEPSADRLLVEIPDAAP